ncbi:MAG TPA: FAD-linked oxidase C-terminal domain-containing protein [Gemmataceae bacterium]|nr:FAD-linked oxidase C-terminal domain-containing protein [Gemmataceae bacterium]
MNDSIELKRTVLAQHLRRHVEGEIRFDPTSRHLYSTDGSIYRIEPLGVVIPCTPQDVVAVVQVAGEMGIPITARGGGTSLSGQSIGPGVVLDCSKYLNQVLDIDPVGRVARVQPGVVLDQFNRALAPHGLQFGPEVATASRANLGGMIGNNSAGARSIVYGKTIDHVRRLAVVLSDGSRADFGPLTPQEWDAKASQRTLEGEIYRGVRQTVRDNAEEIHKRFPRILRRVSGYNLDRFVGQAFQPDQEQGQAGKPDLRMGLHELVIGGEGTLAVVTEAELNLVPRPKARGLLVAHFASLAASMDALAPCLEFRPSAVELLDKLLIELSRGNLSLRDAMAPIVGQPETLLMIEFSGDDPAEVADRVEKLRQRLRGVNGVEALVPALDAAVRDSLWAARSAAAGLLYGVPGDKKPIAFVEDPAVEPARLPEFVARFRDLLKSHGTDGAFYGHASVGCLHLRPMLNLKDPAEVALMRRIAEKVTDLVLEFGGALSGEHGDGLVRSEWNRKMFGPVVYGAFCRVKHLFDPKYLLNPGKVVAADPMTENLRYGPDYHPVAPETVFDYEKQGGFVRAVEQCNGNGACRKLAGGTMCPSFRATRDEKDSTRARANALRLALSSPQPMKEVRSRWVHDVLDLCLMCKACKSECPANVDMAKLKAEFLEHYYEGRMRPLGQRLMANIHLLNRLGAAAAPLVNWLQTRRPLRWLLEKTAGIDRRRSLPPLHAEHFRRWFHKHSPSPAVAIPGLGGQKVLLLDDCFTTFNEPEIGQAAVRVLEAAGCSVELAGLTCCGRSMISKGFLRPARDLIAAQLPGLARRVGDGTPLLGLEPSCLLTLADEWPDLVPGPDARRVADAARLADAWLAQEAMAGRRVLKLKELTRKVLVHGHCHQKALVGVGGTAAALRLVPGLAVDVLDTGCCGMAGSFGFEKEHYDLSVRVAELSLLPALRADTGATVVAPGTSCRHQIKDLDGRRALHPLEVIAGQIE